MEDHFLWYHQIPIIGTLIIIITVAVNYLHHITIICQFCDWYTFSTLRNWFFRLSNSKFDNHEVGLIYVAVAFACKLFLFGCFLVCSLIQVTTCTRRSWYLRNLSINLLQTLSSDDQFYFFVFCFLGLTYLFRLGNDRYSVWTRRE